MLLNIHQKHNIYGNYKIGIDDDVSCQFLVMSINN